eukprot:TRINITY_DN23821_c0_g1_i1.p1 TRINITY_DN23821_c0_g1~~TRINITY_DN23821_c0_g1_i1.p1  ORF type:complete len:385 (+),score=29.18 TRINITY_DN23821_c0_g1_i1:88-1242(+)
MQPPKGWYDYPKMGGLVEGTNLVPVKVMLNRRYDGCLAAEERWGIREMMAEVEKVCGKKVVGVVDLTNTDRYYRAVDVVGMGLWHSKMWGIQGHGKVPQIAYAKEFCETIKGTEQDGVVVVHCTHGINRTGFMICYYLSTVLGVPPAEALMRFHRARPPGMLKAAYVDMLYYLFGGPEYMKGVKVIYAEEAEEGEDETRASGVFNQLDGGAFSQEAFDDQLGNFIYASSAAVADENFVHTPPPTPVTGRVSYWKPSRPNQQSYGFISLPGHPADLYVNSAQLPPRTFLRKDLAISCYLVLPDSVIGPFTGPALVTLPEARKPKKAKKRPRSPEYADGAAHEGSSPQKKPKFFFHPRLSDSARLGGLTGQKFWRVSYLSDRSYFL